MPFPECTRVIYGKNPLIEVICQLRFPPILAINSIEPVEFQESIKKIFPIYELQLEQQGQISFDMQPNQGFFPQMTQSATTKNHKFSSEDDFWHINLTSTFIAISTSHYLRWEDFMDKFMLAFESLQRIYSPIFFDRIGLRYIDMFCRSKLGLAGAKWSDLIRNEALGLLAADEISDKIRMNSITTELTLSDGRSAGKISTSIAGNPTDLSENCFIIDSDFYSIDRHKENTIEKLNYLHDRSSRLVQWLIKEKLHEAMEPEEV